MSPSVPVSKNIPFFQGAPRGKVSLLVLPDILCLLELELSKQMIDL